MPSKSSGRAARWPGDKCCLARMRHDFIREEVRSMKRITGWYLVLALILYLNITLTAHAQSTLPDGEGKAVFERMCSACHGLEGITRAKMSKERWSETVDEM